MDIDSATSAGLKSAKLAEIRFVQLQEKAEEREFEKSLE